VLEAAYPVVTRLLHQRFFAYAADQYIRAHPPAGPCLVEYGASLPEFLEAFPPCQHLLYLPDVARLDWALHRAQHAEDAAAIHPALLRDLGIDEVVRVTFRLHPAVWLLASRWPIDEIWRANQPDADPDITVDLAQGGVRLEVRRDGDDVVFRALDAAGYAFRLPCHVQADCEIHPRGGAGDNAGGNEGTPAWDAAPRPQLRDRSEARAWRASSSFEPATVSGRGLVHEFMNSLRLVAEAEHVSVANWCRARPIL
jgi:Putative DNA-binding domain